MIFEKEFDSANKKIAVKVKSQGHSWQNIPEYKKSKWKFVITLNTRADKVKLLDIG